MDEETEQPNIPSQDTGYPTTPTPPVVASEPETVDKLLPRFPELVQFLDSYRGSDQPTERSIQLMDKYLLVPYLQWLLLRGKTSDNFDDEDFKTYALSAKTRNRNPISYETRKLTMRAVLRLLKWKYLRIAPDDLMGQTVAQHRLRRMEAVKFQKDFKPKPRKNLTMEELEDLFLVCQKNSNRDFATNFLLCYFGMRVGEFNRIEKLSYEEGLMVVRTEKTNVLRIVPFDPFAGLILKRALALGWMSKRMTVYGICKKYQYLFPDDVDYSPHSGRHTYNGWMRRNIKNDIVLKKLLGHTTSVDMSDLYDEAFLPELKKAQLEDHYLYKIPTVIAVRNAYLKRIENPLK